MTRILLLAAGTLSVALGLVGVFVPILPTTPFLLLAALCYARSSERFYRRLVDSRWLGGYIRHYREGRGIPLEQKVATLAILWLTIIHASLFVVSHWIAIAILLAVAGGVTVFLVTRKTARGPD